MAYPQHNTHNLIGWSLSEQTDIEKRSSFKFHFSNEKAAVPASLLLDSSRMLSYMETVGDKIGSKEQRVSASMFFKRYVFCILTSSLYAMSMLNKQFDIRLENVVIIDEEDDEKKHSWLPSFSLQNSEGMPMAGNREHWRSSVVETLFAKNISVMLNHLSSCTKASKAMLWENALIYISWLYNTWKDENHPPEILERLEDDYRFLVKRAEGFHFGTASNPFSKLAMRYEAHQFQQRKTCCLYYRTDGGTCCTTCPLKKAD
ncbi:IucA/IucC family C-terminal-domain containing protein [Fictibacillus fluitans]|uniref:IucA/IucC family C-terminal-domain containing protein n=1 Tax=Fictibacillus fluitans TaxID=3058422 RepID=A0ABT8HSP0_9BACL|nr:IucA/IucC family C-terminal-domain containing protein [Fictibacillus sp. NE201]MDN4523778.1 IucA/IucC family C-terminal-domain containing protein [Fictibacillus sp. NE201]